MTDKEIYEKFIEWLRTTFLPLPDVGEFPLDIVKARYTPEDAALLTGMPFVPTSLEELAKLKGIELDILKARLDELAKQGVVRKTREGTYYLNEPFFVFLRSTFWPGREDEVTKKVAPLANKYYYDGYFDFFDNLQVKGLRSIPIEKTIEDTRAILPYEDVVKVLDNYEYFCVASCPCRHRKNIDPEYPNCTHSVQNCLHFGDLAHYMVEQGLGREITRKEAHEILLAAADEGLVHGINNFQKSENIDTICNCCSCCCMFFEAFHKLKHTEGMGKSNYRVRVDAETCSGCGLCVKRCPMKALKLEESPLAKNETGRISELTPELCIGCGVCVHKCPTESLTLERCEIIIHPPKNMEEFRQLAAADMMAAFGKAKGS
ncbi:MAG: 4Fe-4S binding protein [Thermodesulfobacteriota bacterium]|nr:4Fe-4S binding protein [Thermodesulfobacteriota bacterium]